MNKTKTLTPSKAGSLFGRKVTYLDKDKQPIVVVQNRKERRQAVSKLVRRDARKEEVRKLRKLRR